jgi:hydrogenase nickel incorporation protein HypA/HybF
MQQVNDIASAHGARSVKNVTVMIGPLAGVEPDLLTQAFPIARAGTVADQAELLIESLPLKVRCRSCGAETEAQANRLICGACGDWQTEVISGEEMLLARIELITDNEEEPAHV